MTTNNREKSSGMFRDRTLRAEFRKAALSGTVGAFGLAYVETARAVMRKYPDLQPNEREIHLESLKHHIQETKLRTGKDRSYVIPELVRIFTG